MLTQELFPVHPAHPTQTYRPVQINSSKIQHRKGQIKRLLSRALWEQGIRHALAPGVKRHEWKGAHGYQPLQFIVVRTYYQYSI